MELFAVFAIMTAFLIYSNMIKSPIIYLFSSVITMASSGFMFALHGSGSGGTQAESGIYIMFGIIFVIIAFYQLIQFGREFRG